MATSKPKTGRNTTAITNPKTKSQNTTANTKNAAAGGTKAPAQSGASAGNANKTAAAKSMIASGKSTGAKSAKSPEAKSPESKSPAAGKTASSSKARSCKTGSSKPAAKSAGKTGAKMEAASDCPLKDMDIVSDVLGGQKALIKLYGTALCECDCPNLRTILNSQLSEAAKDQFDTFLYMNQRGMYPTEQAPAPKVSKAVKQFTQKSSAFGK